jgi:hypothetical protein
MSKHILKFFFGLIDYVLKRLDIMTDMHGRTTCADITTPRAHWNLIFATEQAQRDLMLGAEQLRSFKHSICLLEFYHLMKLELGIMLLFARVAH